MERYKLTPEITTGIVLIDRQHAELFERINRLLEAIEGKKASNEVEKTMDFLDTYVMVHLGTEEEFMLEHNYPGYIAHRKQHETFKGNLNKLKKEFWTERSGEQAAVFIREWIGDWFMKHIKVIDMLYVPYLKDKIPMPGGAGQDPMI